MEKIRLDKIEILLYNGIMAYISALGRSCKLALYYRNEPKNVGNHFEYGGVVRLCTKKGICGIPTGFVTMLRRRFPSRQCGEHGRKRIGTPVK